MMFVYLKGHNRHSMCPRPLWFWFLLFKDAYALKLTRTELRGREEKLLGLWGEHCPGRAALCAFLGQ